MCTGKTWKLGLEHDRRALLEREGVVTDDSRADLAAD
jgi:hypothetical protein